MLVLKNIITMTQLKSPPIHQTHLLWILSLLLSALGSQVGAWREARKWTLVGNGTSLQVVFNILLIFRHVKAIALTYFSILSLKRCTCQRKGIEHIEEYIGLIYSYIFRVLHHSILPQALKILEASWAGPDQVCHRCILQSSQGWGTANIPQQMPATMY